ncbi:hypothetical protein GOODEAATRI_025249 [Goodea atripinnis]|uniref:Piezo non-specific cation channel R-Ras-binding domain-containing protein n=1 Tax=Goodea atripinnis TaxID=208336 RepID=A0ABV0PGW1_9TELE
MFLLDQQESVEPIYFYIGTVFGLQAVCVTALFVCSWVMSGTCVAGMLAVSWFVINSSVRRFGSMLIHICLQMFCYLTMSATTFTFLLLWEHGHYVLFVQALCLFLLDSFDLVPHRKVNTGSHERSVGDFVTNFLLCQDGVRASGQDLFLRLTHTSVLPFYVLVLTVCLLSTVQTVFRRLSLQKSLANSLKAMMPVLPSGQPMNTSVRLEGGRIGEQPVVIYHVFHTLFFGFLTLLFDGYVYGCPVRLKVRPSTIGAVHMWQLPGYNGALVEHPPRPSDWFPRALMFFLTDDQLQIKPPDKCLPSVSLLQFYPRVLAELADLQEFYDPDMVELISWIRWLLRSSVSAGLI